MEAILFGKKRGKIEMERSGVVCNKGQCDRNLNPGDDLINMFVERDGEKSNRDFSKEFRAI